MANEKEVKVFITTRSYDNDSEKSSTCYECGTLLESGSWITVDGDNGALCLTCSDLNHLIFLPPGNAALTRRAKKHSNRYAIVLEWRKKYKHYERRGILVEEKALRTAEEECNNDHDIREKKRQREREKRNLREEEYTIRFAQKIREIYPYCPEDTEYEIACHACETSSRRVGRTESAKNYDKYAIILAVIAYIRHNYTDYDKYLPFLDRLEARSIVSDEINNVIVNGRLKVYQFRSSKVYHFHRLFSCFSGKFI